MEEGGCGMSIVLCLYGCVALFLDGFLLGVQASECKVDIRDMLEALFFAAIWPVTLFAYFWQKRWTKGGRK